MKKDQIVPIRLDEKEKEFLKLDADKMGIGTSTLIRMIILDYIKERTKKMKTDD
ncbi:hypothetical protein P9386_01135 [Caldifermentibacillus hisashii]|uniref:plasmid mobilization protein n=1 Tax=Caldifermentibacillus hisashii TaxID=996558 RepID=UPI002DFC615E|nr:hypothetical protein [Caldifermentibacillus hisashii]MED4850475.1 hypothetical protein [Caldifermentibacillus hisashii]